MSCYLGQATLISVLRDELHIHIERQNLIPLFPLMVRIKMSECLLLLWMFTDLNRILMKLE